MIEYVDGAHKTFKIRDKSSLTPEQIFVITQLFNGPRSQNELRMTHADKFSKHIIRPLEKEGLIKQSKDRKDGRKKVLELNPTVKAATTILKNIHYISILQTQGENVYLNYKKTVLSRFTKNTKNIFPNYGEIRKAFYAGNYFKTFGKNQQNKIEMNAIFPLDEQKDMYKFYATDLLETLNSLDKIFVNARIAIYPKEFSEKAQSLYEEFLQLRSYLLSISISPLTKKSIDREPINLLLKNVKKAKDNTKKYFPLSVKETNDILECLRKIIDICAMIPILPIQPIKKSSSRRS